MHAKLSRLTIFAVLLTLLQGCGGAKILREPVAMEPAGPLAVASNAELDAALTWVIVKDGPGTWSRDAYWDEYLLDVSNVSGAELSITTVEVIDALDEPVRPLGDRRSLEQATRSVARRYKKLGYDIAPGANGGHMAVAGVGALAAGTGIAVAGMSGAIAGPAVFATAPMIAATGLVLAAPVLLAGGVVKAVNNDQVNKRILARRTRMPIELAPGENTNLDVFFPVSPSPQQVRVVYETGAGQRELMLQTAESMRGLHIIDGPEISDEASDESPQLQVK